MEVILMALAAALAARFGEETAGAAWAALVRLVKGKATPGTDLERALVAAQAAPTLEGPLRGLADELGITADSDADFKDRVQELWPAASRDLAAHVTHNQISGVVLGNSLQTGTLHVQGDFKFGQQ